MMFRYATTYINVNLANIPGPGEIVTVLPEDEPDLWELIDSEFLENKTNTKYHIMVWHWRKAVPIDE